MRCDSLIVVSVVSVRRVAVVAVLAAAVLLAACGDDDGGAQDTSSRESDVYAAILGTVAASEPHVDETPIIYVAPLGNDKPIPLDVQVSVVDAVADDAVVRFVDEADQAIDQEDDGEPVIDDAVLVRLGAVPPDGRTVNVPGEVYHTKSDTSVVEYKVTQTADGWVVTSPAT